MRHPADTLLSLPMAAQAADASWQAADGGFMSSYVNDFYHDLRSLYSQSSSPGQILGQPMLPEGANLKVLRRDVVASHWAASRMGRRQR